MAPRFTKFAALAALVAALAVSAAAAGASRLPLELTVSAATDAKTKTAELALGFDPESARRRALQGEYNPSFDDDTDDDPDPDDWSTVDDYECTNSVGRCDYDYGFEADDESDDIDDGVTYGYGSDYTYTEEEDEDISAVEQDDGEDVGNVMTTDIPTYVVADGEDEIDDIDDIDDDLDVLNVIERSGGGGGSF